MNEQQKRIIQKLNTDNKSFAVSHQTQISYAKGMIVLSLLATAFFLIMRNL